MLAGLARYTILGSADACIASPVLDQSCWTKLLYHQICKSPIGHHKGAYDFRGVFTVAKGKRTFQPNNRRRARVHGFRLRMRTRAGRAIVSARRRKGRDSLTA